MPPTENERTAASKRAEELFKTGRGIARASADAPPVMQRQYAIEKAVGHGIDRARFTKTWDADPSLAIDALTAHAGHGRADARPTAQTAVSGVPVAAGTGTAPTYPASMAPPGSVAEPAGVRVGARRARVSGESSSPRQLTTATAALGTTSAQQSVQASAAQATTRDRFHQPSVSGNASGAATQRAREMAEVARIRETQVARFGR